MKKNNIFHLPDDNRNAKEYKTEKSALIIIGANGAGKSRLAAWMDNQNWKNVHRILAQKKLNFSDFIPLKSFEQSKNNIFFGKDEVVNSADAKRIWKWNNDLNKSVIKILEDYNDVLAMLFAKASNQNSEFVEKYKNISPNERQQTDPPVTVIDQLLEIWNRVFPHRQLEVKDATITTKFKNIKYKGNLMSDGERVALYLIAQCLCLPSNLTIIIDEPETHLHRSIMNCLWNEIEKVRDDCFFIYLTHDTQFASQHSNSEKLWLKGYDGNKWEYEFIKNSELPEELLLNILGNRRNVLFVEGTYGSLDNNLYNEIYSDYYVIPCGSCREVIEKTKAFSSCNNLHNLKIQGLIDRDYRSEHEIKKLKDAGIYTVDVAEVENLFIVEEVLKIVNDILANSNDENVENAKQYVIDTKFANQLQEQILKAVISEVKFKLETIDISTNKQYLLEKSLENIKGQIDFEKIKLEKENEYKQILQERKYEKILKYFNQKNLVKEIGKYFGISNDEYCNFVLRLLKSKEHGYKIKDAISLYLPNELQIKN